MFSKTTRVSAERTYLRPFGSIARALRRWAPLSACTLALVLGLAGCPIFDSAREQPPVATLGISPDRGPILGGTRVTIVGTNTAVFGDGTEVLFGAFLATDVEVVDESTIRATAPAQAAGHVNVIVRVASGSIVTHPDGFEYVAMADADAEIVAQIEAMLE